ncbi:MAG: hypothetical protein QXS54_04220 [Candidatus Methanomethylicaceae archaeon]
MLWHKRSDLSDVIAIHEIMKQRIKSVADLLHTPPEELIREAFTEIQETPVVKMTTSPVVKTTTPVVESTTANNNDVVMDELTLVELLIACGELELLKFLSKFVVYQLYQLYSRDKIATLALFSYSKSKHRSNLGVYLAQILSHGPQLDKLEPTFLESGKVLLSKVEELAKFVSCGDPAFCAGKARQRKVSALFKRPIETDEDLLFVCKEERKKLRKKLKPFLKLIGEYGFLKASKRSWWCLDEAQNRG